MFKRIFCIVGCWFLLLGSGGSAHAREKISVLDLKPLEVDKPMSQILSEHIRDRIFAQGVYEVMSKEDVYAILDRIECIQEIGAETDTQCVIDAARELGSRYMVVGTLSKLGETYSIHLRLLDTGWETPGVRKRVNRICRCPEDELISAAKTAADDLMHTEREETLPPDLPQKPAPPKAPAKPEATAGVGTPTSKTPNKPREEVKTASLTPFPPLVEPSLDNTAGADANQGLLFINTMKDQAEAYVISAGDRFFAPSSGDGDWRYLGTTPMDPLALPPGKYWARLRFLKGTMDEDIREAVVKAGRTTEHRVLLEQSGLSAGGGGGL